MADEDNFDIDIYGDLDEPTSTGYKKDDGDEELILDDLDDNATDSKAIVKTENGTTANDPTNNVRAVAELDTNMEGSTNNNESESKQATAAETSVEIPRPNNKRKHPDNRSVDANATTALYISDLHWWSTDDDVRGWVHQAECEDELKDITFSEHKVNGKSKGVVFVEFTSAQAATATKNKIEQLSSQPGYQSKRHTVSYTSPYTNPFRTLPKDAPTRNKDDANRSGAGGDFKHRNTNDRPQTGITGGGPNFPAPMSFGQNNMGGGMGNNFRGRGGMMNNNRGNMNQNGFMGRGGMPGPNASPQPNFGMMNQPNGFANNMNGGMQFQGGFQGNRGGMSMGMRGGGGVNRGGRGGFNGAMGTNMPMAQMGGMPMTGMGAGMGMGGNMGNPMGMGGPNPGDMSGGFNPMMGGGFNQMMGGGGAPHFNPAFFGGQQGGGQQEQQWNPHGNKRQRQDG